VRPITIRTSLVLLLAGAAVTVIACAPAAGDVPTGGDGSANGGLVDTSWTVASIAGVPSQPNARPTMTFAQDGTVSGSSSCNWYSASFRTDGSEIAIVQVASTMRMCQGDLGQQEAVFLKGLNGATTWHVTAAGQLEIDGAIGIVAGPGVAEGPPDDAPGLELPGTAWVLTEMGGTADFAHIVPTLAFGEDGTVSGFAGCNTFHGIYSSGGQIRALATTKIGCQRPASTIEAEYLEALSRVTSWTLVDGNLVMDGPVPLTFGPA
jgi:heat shock protein HslJ